MTLLDEPGDFGDDFTTAHAQLMLDFYCKTLTELGYKSVPYPDIYEHIGTSKLATPKYDTLCHALWMCEQCRTFLRGGRLAKSYRWIGMIQGILLMNGVFSIDEMKKHNRFDLPPVRPRAK